MLLTIKEGIEVAGLVKPHDDPENVYTGTAAITTAGVGIALGGLIGGLKGNHLMLNKSGKRGTY